MHTDKIKHQEFLARLPLFNALTHQEIKHIAEQTTEHRLLRGKTIFKRGDACLGFHIVVYGQVKLAFESPQGGEKVVEIISPGCSFGEALMFMEKPYIVSAITLADCFLLHIPKEVIFSGLESNVTFSRKMLAGMSRRLHSLMADIEANALLSGTQRVIGYLLKKDDQEDGDGLVLQTAKSVVASRLNLTPEHFSRILNDLSHQHLIIVHGRKITIPSIEKLRHYGA